MFYDFIDDTRQKRLSKTNLLRICILFNAYKQLVESNDLDCGLVTKTINFKFICLQNSRDELISTLAIEQYNKWTL